MKNTLLLILFSLPFFAKAQNKELIPFYKNNKEEIGVRIPKSEIIEGLHEFLDAPLISTSLSSPDDVQRHFADPDEIEQLFQHHVDLLLDGGIGDLAESTVLDCTSDEIVLVREGKGAVD